MKDKEDFQAWCTHWGKKSVHKSEANTQKLAFTSFPIFFSLVKNLVEEV